MSTVRYFSSLNQSSRVFDKWLKSENSTIFSKRYSTKVYPVFYIKLIETDAQRNITLLIFLVVYVKSNF